jgi:hypothetical protein
MDMQIATQVGNAWDPLVRHRRLDTSASNSTGEGGRDRGVVTPMPSVAARAERSLVVADGLGDDFAWSSWLTRRGREAQQTCDCRCAAS